MCTDFSISTKDNEVVVGRSMELGIELDSELFFRSPGFEYNQNPGQEVIAHLEAAPDITLRTDLPDLNSMYSWKGLYGFTALNAFHSDIVATNGMNTHGLTTGTMVLAQSQYQPFEQSDGKKRANNALFYPYLTTWILSRCRSCQEVIDGLEVNQLSPTLTRGNHNPDRLRVVDPFEQIQSAFRFHFPVQDVEGNAIVLEFVDGQLHISDLNPIGTLTNDPLIGWQQENVISNYVNLSPVNAQNPKSHKGFRGHRFTCETVSQGTGLQGLPGSPTPVDRFVRTSMMTNFSTPVDSKEQASTLAFHVLNTVDIPKGTTRNSAEPIDGQTSIPEDYTQWVTVSDLSQKMFYVRMYTSPLVYSVDLKALEKEHRLEDLNTHFKLPVEGTAIPITNEIQ
ncbi:linear amide C-N hydrolase [Endozoicomonas lisbonensis]|uniref:Penicillin V acylase-like amidase (Ntn superfamily) n=1 Tax=Endozoicomonas lisbonensis TaxID=3120522 RepID=A0ABV2SCK9_9GAMM